MDLYVARYKKGYAATCRCQETQCPDPALTPSVSRNTTHSNALQETLHSTRYTRYNFRAHRVPQPQCQAVIIAVCMIVESPLGLFVDNLFQGPFLVGTLQICLIHFHLFLGKTWERMKRKVLVGYKRLEALKGLNDVCVKVIAALADSNPSCGKGTLTGNG